MRASSRNPREKPIFKGNRWGSKYWTYLTQEIGGNQARKTKKRKKTHDIKRKKKRTRKLWPVNIQSLYFYQVRYYKLNCTSLSKN